jgi:caffeoyl-CoA O-methyltransferase
MSEIIQPVVSGYLDRLVPEREPELQRMEIYAREHRFPIIGPACGHLCYQLARTIGARRVFELGSGFGYSTAFFARAVKENGGGVVHHVVWDQQLSDLARGHLGALGYEDIVEYHVAEAIETLRRTDGPFDIIFNDIDKHAYPESLEAIEPKLRPGGLLIVDNMLWSGRIFDDADRSADTEGIRAMTRAISRNGRWITSIVPIRDGLVVATRQP